MGKHDQEASSSNSKKGNCDTKTQSVLPVPVPVYMPDWLFRDAVEGLEEKWESQNQDRVTVNVIMEGSEASPTWEIKEEIVIYLESTTHMGNTVLHVLATYGHTELVNMICQKDRSLWKTQNKMLETPFHCAAKAGNDETVAQLINFARDDDVTLKSVLRKKNKNGDTALHDASRRGYSDVVSQLMVVDPILACEFNDDGVSSLYLAAARQTIGDNLTVKIILQLLDKKIDPLYSDGRLNHTESTVAEDADISGIEPIHFLVSAGSTQVVEDLLKRMPSLAYLEDSKGFYPVHLAARTGNAEMVALFVQMFPDSVELLDKQGRNFFHIAAEENVLYALFDLIMQNVRVTPNSVRRLHLFFKAEEIPLFYTNLLTPGGGGLYHKYEPNYEFPMNMKEMSLIMINEVDNEGNTPLHLAAKKGCKSTMNIIWAIKVTAQTIKFWNSKYLVSIIMGGGDKYILGYENIDLKLRNREKLTAFDISVEFEKSAEHFQATKEQIQQYVSKHGAVFTSSWFKGVLQIRGGEDTNSVMVKLQLIGLGAVLITTIAFAVAFTLPGGYDSNGSPLLAQEYLFKAFILADTFAFILSASSVASIVYGGLTSDADNDGFITVPLILFSIALKCMILAFGLGLYLMLAPVIKGISILILVIILLPTVIEFLMTIATTNLKKYSLYPDDGGFSYIYYVYGLLFIFLFPLLM